MIIGENGGLSRLSGAARTVLLAFDEMPALLLAMSGPDHRISAVNEACRALFGRGDVVGMPLRQAVPEVAGQQLFEVADRVYATGEPESGREWRIQVSRPDGTMAERFVDFTLIPTRTADGVVAGLAGAGIDVTRRVRDRQAAEAEAEEAQLRYLAVSELVATLQAALLPTALPVLPQARIAARYLVAGTDQAAGGDWFDAVPVTGGRVALVVGDVVGHGVRAAAAMAQLRAVLNELLVAEPDLVTVLTRADAFAARTPGLAATTLAVAVLDPADGTLRYTTCGHPAPLVVGSGGEVRFLPRTGNGPLGTGSVPALATGRLEPGEVVLLYSDGLIERPGRTMEASSAELAAVAADAATNRLMPAGAAATPSERVCQLTVELLTRTGYADDVTTLAAERLGAPVAARHLTLPCEVPSLRVVRRALDDWLAAIGPLADDRDAVHMAVVEVVTNSIEHAYRPGDQGLFEFDLALQPDGDLDCRVADYGRWRPPDPAATDRGNGLMVARHMVDELQITHPADAAASPGAASTVVRLRHRLRRPAMLASDTSAEPASFPPASDFEVDADLDGSLATARVSGAIDISTADELLRKLLAACRGGTVPLTVDLSGVTRLASAGVSALYELTRQLAAHRRDLRLIASAGGAASSVLELVGLRYSPADP